MAQYTTQQRYQIIEIYFSNQQFIVLTHIHNLIMSDEAHFQLNGFVNKQNCRIWATENPRVLHQRQLHPAKCTDWCGVSSEKNFGPYFFENERGVALSINGDRYRAML